MEPDVAALILPRMEADGGLVALRASMAGEEDWRGVLDLLKTSAAMVDFSVDDLPRPLPPAILPLFDEARRVPVLLSCRVSGILFNARFKDPARLELEIDAREVDARRVEDFARFWRTLGDLLRRPVSLLDVQYDPNGKRFVVP
ncbi:MAG TPA: hypothetical protein VF950_30150 [Planctomycetota bacterium]